MPKKYIGLGIQEGLPVYEGKDKDVWLLMYPMRKLGENI